MTLGPVKFEEATHEVVPDATGEKGPRIEASRAAYRAHAVCEDQSCMEVVTDGPRPHVFCAIFNGHNGPLCSSFLRKHCYEVLCTKMKKHGRVVDFIRATCEELDVKFMRNHPQFRDYVQGSCLLLAYVDLKARRLYVGNVGDSRAVLGRKEGRHIVSETLTVDHNTATKSERLRVLAEHPGMVDAMRAAGNTAGSVTESRPRCTIGDGRWPRCSASLASGARTASCMNAPTGPSSCATPSGRPTCRTRLPRPPAVASPAAWHHAGASPGVASGKR